MNSGRCQYVSTTDHFKDAWSKLLDDNPMPAQGTEDVSEVLESPYLFS